MKVLVVDDNRIGCVALQAQISWAEKGWKVESQPLVSKAIEALAQRPYDAVLCAAKLPDADALSLLERLNESGEPYPPIVVLGEESPDEAGPPLLGAGAQDYLHKPSAGGTQIVRALRFAIVRSQQRGDTSHERPDSRTSIVAEREPLTELYNRRGLEDLLERVIDDARESGRAPSAMLVDFENMRALAQSFGLYVVDQLILVIADILRDIVGQEGELAVIDGEYFIAILPGMVLDNASGLAQRAVDELANVSIPLPSGTARPTTTVKVARLPATVETVHDLLDAIQLAEPEAFEEADIVAHQRVDGGLVAIDRLTSILESDDKLEVIHQVVLDIKQQRPFIHELFVRGLDELHQPAKMFAAARELELETDLDLKCLELCLRSAPHFPQRTGLCVNVLPQTILATRPETLANACRHNAPDHIVIFDISIRRITGNPSPLFRALAKLDKLGIPTSLDHVDVSKSSMRAITLQKPRIVKTNPDMILGIAKDPVKRQNLQRLLAKVKSVGSELVALGVENEDDLREVRSLGVRFGQGYLMGRPEPLPERPQAAG